MAHQFEIFAVGVQYFMKHCNTPDGVSKTCLFFNVCIFGKKVQHLQLTMELISKSTKMIRAAMATLHVSKEGLVRYGLFCGLLNAVPHVLW